MTDEEQIRDIYRKYWGAMIAKDADALRMMMSEEYTLVHMTGIRQSKESFLKGLMEGTFNYYSAAHDSIEVKIHGNTAEMIGKSRVDAAVYGGGKHSWRLRGDFELRKNADLWKLVSSRASTY